MSSARQTKVPSGAPLYRSPPSRPLIFHKPHPSNSSSNSCGFRQYPAARGKGGDPILPHAKQQLKKNHFRVTYTGPILQMHGEFTRQLREITRVRSGGRTIPGDADCCAFNKMNFLYLRRNHRQDLSEELLQKNKREVIEFHEEKRVQLLEEDSKLCHRRNNNHNNRNGHGASDDDLHFLKALVTAAVNFQRSHDTDHHQPQNGASSENSSVGEQGNAQLPPRDHSETSPSSSTTSSNTSIDTNSSDLDPLPDNFATRILRSADAAARVHRQARTVTAKKARDYGFVLNALFADVENFVPALGHRKTLEALSKLDLWKVSN